MGVLLIGVCAVVSDFVSVMYGMKLKWKVARRNIGNSMNLSLDSLYQSIDNFRIRCNPWT